MTWTAQEAEAALVAWLEARGQSVCDQCGLTPTLEGVTWNNGETEAGTGFTEVTVECPNGHYIEFKASWSGAENVVDAVENVLCDGQDEDD